MKDSKGDKATGPDGFNMFFIKSTWNIIKSDLVEALKEFQVSSFLPSAINSIFICLIPKKDFAGSIGDFRPISLVGIIYKIMSKCLMKRFKKCLGKVINASQNVFLDNRQIVDAALVANELLDSRRASGKNGIPLKLDLEKAFDSVSWDFILFMLKRFNFPNTWISWIQSCIFSMHYSVLVNGAPYDFFSSKRGICQDDSISPYLFICAMEILSGMLSKANDCDFFKGFMMNEREGESVVTHLLHVDDALIFYEDSKEQDPCALHGRFTTMGSSLFTLSMSTSFLNVTKGNMIFQQIRFGLAAFHPKYVVLCG
ncbi:LINE-1 retrotransposable element ORF2 protein [Linum grandiflorum]